MPLTLKFCFGQGDEFLSLNFFKRSLFHVNKIGCCIDILIASGYHSCDGQAGVTRIIVGTLSLGTLLKTFGIM